MIKHVSSLIAGLIFGIGLVISGMANPQKVLNFLDLFGTFDPSLMFVMIGAIVVTFIGFKVVLKRDAPICDNLFHLPTRSDIDKNLLAGSALFGIGWGLGGLCPGPAVTSLLLGSSGIIYFIPAMLLGLFITKMIKN